MDAKAYFDIRIKPLTVYHGSFRMMCLAPARTITGSVFFFERTITIVRTILPRLRATYLAYYTLRKSRANRPPIKLNAFFPATSYVYMYKSAKKKKKSDSSKLKQFAVDIFIFDENGRKLSKQLENTVGKGEIAR